MPSQKVSKSPSRQVRSVGGNGHRLAAIVESADDAIIAKTLDGEITCWNRAAQRLYGYCADEAIGQPISIIVPEDKRDELDRIFQRLKAGEVVEPFETVRLAKDGSRRNVALTISPIRDDSGTVTGASSIARDITERKRAEARLATEHAVARSLAEASSFEEASAALLKTITLGVGCELGELWVHSEARGVLTRAASANVDPTQSLQTFDRESGRFEVSYKGKGLPGRVWRTRRPTWVVDIGADRDIPRAELARSTGVRSAMAFPVNTGSEFYGVMMFFTTRRLDPDPHLLNMMKALGTEIGMYIRHMKIHADHANLAAIIASSNDAIFSWSTDGTITSWNPEAERVFARPAHEVIGGSLYEIIPKEQKIQAKRWINKLIRDQRGGTLGEITYRHMGEDIRLSLTVSPIKDHTGALIGFSTIARDVTTERKAEESLRRAKEDAERANQAKSQFLAAMSHELRTPLNGMLSTADLLLNSGLTPHQREYAEILRDSGEQLEYLVNDLLDLSKIETGHLELRVRMFDLRTLLDNLTTVWEARAELKGVDFFVSIQPGLPLSFLGDEHRIRQVLENLISNAVKYTDSGFVAVRASGTGITEKSGTLRLEIKDTGVGIDREARSRLFKRFERGDSTSTETEGNGLGLAICKELVDLMGGQIGVDSVPGRGSTFWFTVPVKTVLRREAIRPTTRSRASPATPNGKTVGRRILVVDDNPTNLKILTDILSLAGHTVDEATDGFQAVRAARERRYDLIFMDVRMPDMDGVAAAREIRAVGNGGELIPIVAVTANAMQGDRERYLDDGLTDYLAKPFHLQDVLAIVNRLAGCSTASVMPN